MLKLNLTKCFLAGLLLLVAMAPSVADSDIGGGNSGEEVDGQLAPLPRYREGGTPYDAGQSLYPSLLATGKLRDMPTSGLLESPPEYGPCRGVLFYYNSGQWPAVVRDLVVALTQDPQYDEIAYVVVSSAAQQTHATNVFTAGGADMSKVEFILEAGNALWIRDYGPHFVWQNGALTIVDSHYYPSRPLDNFMPTLLGDDHFFMPTYDMGLYYSGGNFQPGPGRMAVVSALVLADNPAAEGFDETFIAELYQKYQGIDSLHIFPQLPYSVDGTGHIDMWMYLIDENSVIISEFIPGSNATAITITNNAVPYMEALGFEVHRTPAWNVGYTHYTYTNGFRVNDRIFVPTYASGNPGYADEDAAALATFQAAAGPEVDIVPIDCYSIIPAAGAIHCIVMQVPRRVDTAPQAHIIRPNGGELFVSGTDETIAWVATDEDNDTIPTVELYYSVDNGDSWDFIAATDNSGYYDWSVPEVFTDSARVKVIAIAADADESEAISDEVFQIWAAEQTVYDFSDGAGVDKTGWGHETLNWTAIDGNRTPVATEIRLLDADAYDKISRSDATGGDGDGNRYVSPDPTNNYESTHTFEFTINEEIADIADIEIIWEGYSDNCAQMELYVWDYVEGHWSDCEGFYNQNRFVDNWAGNRDGYLEKHLRSNFSQYISGGQLTLLLYSERGPDGYYVTYNPTYHDYIAVTVSTLLPSYLCGDADGNELVNVSDAVYLIEYIFAGGPPPEPLLAGDVDCDEIVNVSDAVYLITYIFASGPVPCAECK